MTRGRAHACAGSYRLQWPAVFERWLAEVPFRWQLAERLAAARAAL